MGECDSSYTGGGTCEPPRIPQPPSAPSGKPDVKAVPLHQCLVPLRTKEEVRRFLKAIRKDFVSTVNVVESGLHDQLRQLKVLTDTDNESLNGRHLPVPRDKASRLWDILFAMDHDVIVRDVIPALCERHYHIIPQQFWKTTDACPGNDSPGKLRQQRSAGRRSGSCLRCDIQLRVRFVTVVDFLYEHNALSDLKHRELTRNHRLKPEDWPCVFSTFASLASQPPAHLNDAMTSLLQRHSLPVPGDVLTLMAQGMPCQCRDKRRDFNTLAKKQLAIWRDRCVERSKDGISNVSDETATTTYPPSDHDSSQFSSHITQSSDSQTRLKTVEPQSSNFPPVQDLDENDTATSYPLHRLLSEQSQTSRTDTYSRNTLNLRTSTPRQTHYSQVRTWSGSDFQSMKKQALEDFKVDTEVGQECCPLSRGRSGSEESLASIVFKELEDSRSVGGEHGSVGGAWTKEDGGSVCEGTIIASSQGTFVSYFRESSSEGFSGAGSSVTDTSVIKDGGGGMELEQPGTGWGDEADVQSSHHRGQVSLWPCGESSSDWLSLSTLKDSLEGLDGRVPVGTCVGGTVSPATNKSETNEGSVHGGAQSEGWFLEGRESDRLPSEGTGGSSTHPRLQLTPSTASKANLSVSQIHPTTHQQDCKTNLPLHPAALQQDSKTSPPLYPTSHQQDGKTNPPLHPAAHQQDGKTNPPLYPTSHQQDDKTNPPLYPTSHQPDHTNMGERSEHPEALGPSLPDVPPASTNLATRSTVPSSLPLVKKTGDVVGGGIPGVPLRSPGEQVRSPVSRLAADLSPDEEKAKRLKKALFKGHYDQVKCVLPGAALEHHNVNATSRDSDITKSCVTHPEQRESDQGEEEEEGVLQAKQNADLMEFRQYALSEVTTGADLRKLWLKKASLVDTAMTDNIQHLLESYVAMEMLYGELQQKQPGECGPMQQQDDILSQPGPQSDLTHLTSLFSKVLGMGAELLLSCRIFLLCAFYLNTPTSSTTPRYRASAHALARDVILLSDWTRLQAWQHVTQLEEMIGQLGGEGGVAIAAVPESLDLVRRFLDMELQGY